MKLRSQLLVVFFLLAVVPLAGLTLYSYYTSLKAFRKAVAAEAAQMAEDMTGRMEAARRDLDRRVRMVGVKPLYTLAKTPTTTTAGHVPEMQQIYSDLVAALGDTAKMFESIKIEPMVVAAASQAVEKTRPSSRVPAPQPPLRPGDSLQIVMPGMPEPPPPGLPAAPPPEEVAMDMPEGGKLLMRHWDASSHGGRPAGSPGQRREIQLHWVARLEEETRRAESAEAAAGPQAGATEPYTAAQHDSGEEGEGLARTKQKRVECLDFTTEVRVDEAVGGKIIAQVNAHEILKTVLSRTRLREREIAFAQDQDQRLYTARPDDQATLAQIGVVASPGDDVKPLPEDWLVVRKTDEATGVTFGIARPIGDGLRQIRQAAVQNLSWGLGMVTLALLGILPLSRRMTRNLTVLSGGVERLAAGDLDVQVPLRSRDEIGQLGEAFNRMARELKEHQARVMEQERLRKEPEMCRRIQRELLPRGPLRLPLAEVQGVSIPAREVGGDFFNYFTLPDGRTALLIADVSGKGVPAALLMANLQATLRARLPVAGDLVSMARELDREIEATTPPETYLTLFVAILDQEMRTLRWLNAGHNPQYIVRAGGELEAMPSTGRPLGLLPGGPFEEQTTQLHPGDTLFLYTDGLVEAQNPRGEEFGNQRLERILSEERGQDSQHILARIEEEVRVFGRDFESSDDATMLVLRTTE
jgi:serine phosphatase RsbU (regulator of sigma subunit)